MESEKYTRKVDKNILDLLWKLTNNKTKSRIDACSDILRILQRKQTEADSEEPTKDSQYVVERLVKGLASSRDAARLGFALLLTEILKQTNYTSIEDILELIKQHLSFSTKQERRDMIFGQLFAYSAIVRSGKLADHSHLPFVVTGLYDLWQGKSYILNASYEILKNLFSQISSDKFKEHIWPVVQQKLTTGWENSSADSMWPLLLCVRMFPEVVTQKYLKKNWKCTDLLSPENFDNLKVILKQTSALLPILHPFCLEFLTLIANEKNLKHIWNAVIDDNLFEADFSEKCYIGFEMVKKAIQEHPKKKIIKTVLSSKFRTLFAKSLLSTKHPMHPAAECLAGFLSAFVKESNDPVIQMIILKVFLQPPGSLLSDQMFKRKEVSSIVQNLLPEAVKDYCELLKSIAISKTDSEEEDGGTISKRFQAVSQIGSLVCHQITITDIEWRLNTIKFMFLHAFFHIKEPTSEVLHCDVNMVEIPAALRNSFVNAFYKSVLSLYQRIDHTAPLDQFLQHLMVLTEYMDQLMMSDQFVTPHFPLEKIQVSWEQMKGIVHKLGKQSKKDGKNNESNAFQALFLQLAFHLFGDPDHIPEVLEELHICCKKALHARKHPEEETSSDEPSWVGVVVDILLSLLSRDSHSLRTVATSVFPLLCSFITEDALQQILSVIQPEKAEDEPMLVDGTGEESDIEFDSGSSSDESDSDEKNNAKVDEQFRAKVKEALGHAAEVSDAESIVLSDSEMFKLDDTLAEAFRSRVQVGHTELSSKDKAMLHFRVRCLDLITIYLKSEPPMRLMLQCVEPVLAAYEYGQKGHKAQGQLLHKAISTLQILTKNKKFHNEDYVEETVLIGLLDILISKCHKETNVAVANKLYAVCVFLVLCFRRLEVNESSSKKSKKASYMQMYLSALEQFVKGSNSNIYPNFFASLMKACPDLAWNFIGPCEEYAFDKDVRMYRRTQCLGLIFEALKFSKGQSSITPKKWSKMASSLFPKAVETLKDVLQNSSFKPAYLTELLDVICSLNTILKEKTDQSLLEAQASDLLPLLEEMSKEKTKKLAKKGAGNRRKLILALGGKIQTSKKSNQNVAEESDVVLNGNGDVPSDNIASSDKEVTDLEESHLKQKKRTSKKIAEDLVPNGTEEDDHNDTKDELSGAETKEKRKSKGRTPPKKKKLRTESLELDD